MTKTLKILFLFLFSTLAAKAEVNTLEIKGYEVAVFSKDEPIISDDTAYRWTPEIQAIEQGLRAMKSFLKDQHDKKNLINQKVDGCPIIYKKLKKYYYQVFGIINKKGERILFINALWKKSFVKDQYDQNFVSVFDGCSRYWSIKINLDSKDIHDFLVNGLA